MSLFDDRVTPRLRAYASRHSLLDQHQTDYPKRTAPFDVEPGFHLPANLWLYGNARLLQSHLAYIPQSFGSPQRHPDQLDDLEKMDEELVLAGRILVCGIHNPVAQRVALVPLRWGAPRIIVFSGGFHVHLGADLKNEPFRAARLWRYQWDAHTDLAISRRSPDKLPTYALHNPTVDRMIERIAGRDWHGLVWTEKGDLRVLA